MHAQVTGPVFYWDVDNPVILNGANNFEDVLFIQWCFYKMSKWDQINSELRAICAKNFH